MRACFELQQKTLTLTLSRSTGRGERGFTITELLATLVLLVLFFSAAGELFRSTILLSSGSQELSNRASQIDSALFQLRRDVWNSAQIAATSPQSVDLSSPDGTKTAWTINPGSLTRTDARGQTERWACVGNDWSFSTDAVSLTISDAASAPIRLPSQILLEKGTFMILQRGHS
jgi:prepilin-type N-terminal cleavage/methylation domain-containing protein